MGTDAGKTKAVVAVLALIILIMAIILTIVTWQLYSKEPQSGDCIAHGLPIDTSTPDPVPPFHDLTEAELINVQQFLYKQNELPLVRSAFLHTVNSSFIMTMELHLPNKNATLAFLDDGAEQPVREAIVTIYRGDAPNQGIDEYIVGPADKPSYKRLSRKINFAFRPFTVYDYFARMPELQKAVDSVLGTIIEESYGGRLQNCSDRCIEMRALTAYSTALSGDSTKRLSWVTLAADVEYHTLHFYDMQFLIDITTQNSKIVKVYYAGQNFNTMEELATAYGANTIKKTKVPFPKSDKNLFSAMHRRGKLFPENPMPPPRSFNPAGQRYSIKGRHISYMGWDFDLRMSTLSGPQIFDVRYQSERIVYELSLQEIAVFYSGHSPSHRVADFLDSMVLLGNLARSLVPGVDCPGDSTFLTTQSRTEYSEDVITFPKSFCVFEHNSNIPLRRHLSSFYLEHHFFEGMMDTALVIRTIITVGNYDYILDFMFHQNGALQVKASSTGYIIGSFFAEIEKDYGFRLHEQVLGNIHTHLFHFKVDLDIKGRENVFERLDLQMTEVNHSDYSSTPGATYSQMKVVRNEVKNEKSGAIIDVNDTPAYYTFYNKKYKTKHGVPKAYRLHSKGVVKQLLAKGKGNEPSISWARYPLAVTKYKETERRSSSYYASWDATDPVVNFQSFIDDNETLTDQDLVCWVTLGLHHVPHTEDLPVTPTVGLELEFYLLPHNYFDEDPAMGSSDSVRIEQIDENDIDKGLKITEYSKHDTGRCLMKERYNYEDLKKTPRILFDSF